MGVNTRSGIVTSGLALYYDAANRKSYSGAGTSVTDLSGNGNVGTLVNGTGYNSINGGSFVFDSTSDAITVGQASKYFASGSLSFTFEAWIKTPGLGSGMVVNGIFGFSYGNNMFLTDAGEVYFRVYNEPGATWAYQGVTAGLNLHDNKWHHTVGVIDGTLAYIYVDGLQRQFTSGISWTGTNAWISMEAEIGRDQNNITTYFNGNIAIAKFYKKGLSALEVLQNYNATKSRFGLT